VCHHILKIDNERYEICRDVNKAFVEQNDRIDDSEKLSTNATQVREPGKDKVVKM
jgi:hypothetical protein